MEAKWSQDLTKALLDGTTYSGSKVAKERVFSASMLGKEPYINMMKYLHGNFEQEEYGANTTGSLYQLGIDSALKDNEQYTIAKRIKYTLPNGWVISGEMDMIDEINKVIIDAKLIAISSYNKVISNIFTHEYNLQLAVYRWLMWKETGEEYECALHAVNKGGSKTKKNLLSNFTLELISLEEIEEMLIAATDELQKCIDTNTMPQIGCDIFKFGKVNGVANRCKNFCDYNKVCPQYTDSQYGRDAGFAKSLEVDW
jgi:hypothetical protein